MFQQAQLAIPAFTKGKDQPHLVDMEKTMGIANVRINSRRKGCWSSSPEVLDIVWNSAN